MLLNNQESLLSDLLASLENPEFCDTKIESSDGNVQANKAILSMRSEYFSLKFYPNDSLLFSPNNSSVESSASHSQSKLPYSKAVVKKMVLYLYSGMMDVTDLALGQLLDLMELLNLMDLSEEFQKLETYTLDKIRDGELLDIGDLSLGQLLDLMKLLNLMKLSEKFQKVESFTVNKIKDGEFIYSDCLKNLDKCSKLGLEAIGEKLLTYLANNMSYLCELEEVCILSETMIIKLLQREDGDKILYHDYGDDDEEVDPDYDPDNDDDKEESDYEEEEETDYELSEYDEDEELDDDDDEEEESDDEDDDEESQNTLRFKTFVTWLSANSMDADEKDKVLETFDFESFNIEELASVVRSSGFYSSDKIIARMEQLYKDLEEKGRMEFELLKPEEKKKVTMGQYFDSVWY